MQRSLSRILRDSQDLGLGVGELCAHAGVSRATVHRGKRGIRIGDDVIDRLSAVVRDTAAKRRDAAARVLG